MRKKKKKNEWERGKMCKEKKNGRKRERKMDRNKLGRDKEILLDTDKNRNIDLLGKKVSIFCRTHIAVGHRI